MPVRRHGLISVIFLVCLFLLESNFRSHFKNFFFSGRFLTLILIPKRNSITGLLSQMNSWWLLNHHHWSAAESFGSFSIPKGKWTNKAGDLSRSAVPSLRMWFSGERGATGLVFDLWDFRGLFQPLWFYESYKVLSCLYSHLSTPVNIATDF